MREPAPAAFILLLLLISSSSTSSSFLSFSSDPPGLRLNSLASLVLPGCLPPFKKKRAFWPQNAARLAEVGGQLDAGCWKRDPPATKNCLYPSRCADNSVFLREIGVPGTRLFNIQILRVHHKPFRSCRNPPSRQNPTKTKCHRRLPAGRAPHKSCRTEPAWRSWN